VPVALDEELIGVKEGQMEKLLLSIKPAYIVLKPGILGGFKISADWIKLAGKYNTGWWITSALESNIGLNAIAQFCSSFPNAMPQGLGTGKLYSNNFQSPLFTTKGSLAYRPFEKWKLPEAWSL
jgi:O-succinylbenzoate synthase